MKYFLIILLLWNLHACGKKSSNDDESGVDGLPGDWDGQGDYNDSEWQVGEP